jgi:hypothetical protein
MAKFTPIIPVEDDGLYIPEVGAWGDEKYKLLGGYSEIFTSGMKIFGTVLFISTSLQVQVMQE